METVLVIYFPESIQIKNIIDVRNLGEYIGERVEKQDSGIGPTVYDLVLKLELREIGKETAPVRKTYKIACNENHLLLGSWKCLPEERGAAWDFDTVDELVDYIILDLAPLRAVDKVLEKINSYACDSNPHFFASFDEQDGMVCRGRLSKENTTELIQHLLSNLYLSPEQITETLEIVKRF